MRELGPTDLCTELTVGGNSKTEEREKEKAASSRRRTWRLAVHPWKALEARKRSCPQPLEGAEFR